MPMVGKAGANSQPKDVCVFRIWLALHMDLWRRGGHSGGIAWTRAAALALSTAYSTGDDSSTLTLL